MRPEQGSKMVCINRDGWRPIGLKARIMSLFGFDVSADGPDYGDIVTVTGYEFENGQRYLKLEEWNGTEDSFRASAFQPLTYQEETNIAEEAIEKQIEEILSVK